MEIILKFYPWTLTILALLVFFISRIGIPIFVNSWRKSIRNFVDKETSETNNKEAAKRQTELIDKRAAELGFITITVACIEFIVFGFLSVLVFIEKDTALGMAGTFGAFLGGWLTLKILSGNIFWSHEIAGKAYYHTSLVAALLNVAAAFISGFLIYAAWFAK